MWQAMDGERANECLQALDAILDQATAEMANPNAHITISVETGVPAKLAGKFNCSFCLVGVEQRLHASAQNRPLIILHDCVVTSHDSADSECHICHSNFEAAPLLI